MNLTPEDIEKIVRQVLKTLLEGNAVSSGSAPVQPVVSNVGAAPVLSVRNATPPVSVSPVPASTAISVASSLATPGSAPSGSVPSGDVSNVNSSGSDSKEIVLDEAVISAGLLGNALPRGKDRTVQSVRVKPSAVITPAAKDILRERKIQIVRAGTTSQASASSLVQSPRSEPSVANNASDKAPDKALPRPQRLVVAGTSSSMDALGKQVCPKQANVLPKLTDDSAVLRSVLDGLKAGHQAAVVWVDSPHNVCWQAARHESLRPVVVSQWSDLSEAMKEVPANLLILSKKQWTIPALGNATRLFFEHLKKHN